MGGSGADASLTAIDRDLPASVTAVLAEVEADASGLYGPDSVSWRLNRERALRLGCVSAMLVQWAHPALAQSGVDYYPDTGPPFAVSMAVYDFLETITFGTVDEAVREALDLRDVHDRATGAYDRDLGRYAAGERYDANEPADLRFVHATMIDHALRAYELFVGDLSEAERERYYQESQRLGRLVGVPASSYPDTLDGFYDEYERVIDAELEVGRYARQLQRTMFEAAGPTRSVQRLLAVGLLPEPVRTAYGYPWSGTRQRVLDGLAALVRSSLPHLPDRLRYVEAYRDAR